MRDVHDGRRPGRSAVRWSRTAARLRAGQRRGRLVHDQHTGLVGQCTRELHHLLLREPELADGTRTSRVRPSPVSRRSPPRLMRRQSTNAPAPRRFPEIDVLRHRQVRDQHQLLIDDADAEPAGVVRTRDLDRLPPRRISPGILPHRAAQDLDERRLAGPVLAEEHVDLARSDVEIDRRRARRRPGSAWRCSASRARVERAWQGRDRTRREV